MPGEASDGRSAKVMLVTVPASPERMTHRHRPQNAKTQEEAAMLKSLVRMGVLASAAVMGAAPLSVAQAAWEPTRPVEIVVPAGPGGGADQMARVVQGIVTKHNLMKQSLIVVNKAGGA